MAELIEDDRATALHVALDSVLRNLGDAGTAAADIYSIVRKLDDLPEALATDSRSIEAQLSERRDSGIQQLRSGALQNRARILVIDDDAAVGRMIKRVLDRHYDITIETSSASAVYRVVLGADYDVILCDVTMPIMSGIDVYKAVIAARPELVLQFIFMSDGIRGAEAQEFFDKTCSTLVDKPFTIDALLRAIESVLRLEGEHTAPV